MNTQPTQDENGIVACEVCFKEIPISEASHHEASDYVHHYCGLECFAKWRGQIQHDEQKDDLNNTALQEEAN